jgi:hypothetical protein
MDPAINGHYSKSIANEAAAKLVDGIPLAGSQ